MQKLSEFYADTGPERVGFILKDGSIFEVENISPDASNGFEVADDIMVTFEKRIVATWHTHPGKNSNLSVDDLKGFKNWPRFKHYIVGNDGVRGYHVHGGEVLQNGC